jgi:hypothetical protein
MSDHIEIHYGNLPAGEDTNLVLGSVFQYGLRVTAGLATQMDPTTAEPADTSERR